MISIVLAFVAFGVVVAPAWWVAGRVQDDNTRPFFRFLFSVGIALVGYISFVNLIGRVAGHSTTVASAYLLLSFCAGAYLVFARREEITLTPLLATWRDWVGPVAMAMAIALPQWILAVSSPLWDETASSAIHITAPNQFAEGIFPPRHNALPGVVIKYHYAFTILSGTVRWLTHLSANASVDIASTCLWLFTLLFVVFWLRDLAFSRAAAWWGGFASLLGGGLSWLFIRHVEVYNGFEVSPPGSMLIHKYDAATSVWQNLLSAATMPSAHLRNANGTLSNLPWDLAAQMQQHAVAIGVPLTLLAFYLLTRWLTRVEFKGLFALTVATFGVLILGHAVFGGAAAVTAGLVMLILWFREPTRARFVHVTVFTICVTILAILHGGPFATGAQYGANADVLTFRDRFGYSTGGVAGFINWNIAGFGLILLLAIVAWIARPNRDDAVLAVDDPQIGARMSERRMAFLIFTVFAAFSYLIPQFTFYSSETSGVEQFTEISKFFFAARLGFALLSAFGVAWLVKRWHWSVLAPAYAASALMPLMFMFVNSTTALDAKTVPDRQKGDSIAAAGYKWLGFYHSPYYQNSIEKQAGETLGRLKHSNADVYFDASRDERKHGYLNELLIFGGSVFTLTPSRYERTGSGFRLAEKPVADRLVLNGRMARLLPGAAEACSCKWFYARPQMDMMFAPMIVRSRFEKAVAENYFTSRFSSDPRVLYSIDKPTADLDRNIEWYWRPRVVSQTRTDWDGDGKSDLIFYDYVQNKIIAGNAVIDVPEGARHEMPQLFVGRFPGDGRVSLLLARLGDTEFHLGRSIDDIVEQSPFAWSYRPAAARSWDPEYTRWDWDLDIPLIADLDHDGFDTHLAFRPATGEWTMAPATKLNGPASPASEYPLPFAGHFLSGSNGDLGIWNRRTGMLTLQSITSAQQISFKWGGFDREVLVNGDYNGDGFDEIGVYNGQNQFWYFRSASNPAITQFKFGTETAVPLPADYNHDGRIDPAYWEPRQNKIFVTFSGGRSVDLLITVPPHTIPAFVNMF